MITLPYLPPRPPHPPKGTDAVLPVLDSTVTYSFWPVWNFFSGREGGGSSQLMCTAGHATGIPPQHALSSPYPLRFYSAPLDSNLVGGHVVVLIWGIGITPPPPPFLLHTLRTFQIRLSYRPHLLTWWYYERSTKKKLMCDMIWRGDISRWSFNSWIVVGCVEPSPG